MAATPPTQTACPMATETGPQANLDHDIHSRLRSWEPQSSLCSPVRAPEQLPHDQSVREGGIGRRVALGAGRQGRCRDSASRDPRRRLGVRVRCRAT